ncbi:MAG: hypothetical protein LRZ85_06685 [Alphaproteobacteria bacterium]|nr:hypothetical protein [Alphaproteobacteria bacterium]
MHKVPMIFLAFLILMPLSAMAEKLPPFPTGDFKELQLAGSSPRKGRYRPADRAAG